MRPPKRFLHPFFLLFPCVQKCGATYWFGYHKYEMTFPVTCSRVLSGKFLQLHEHRAKKYAIREIDVFAPSKTAS